LTHDISTTDWKELSPKSEFYLFIPRDESLLVNYDKYLKVPDIFPINSVGIVTAKDKFVIDQKREDLERRIGIFRDENTSDDYIEQEFKLKIKTDKRLRNAKENLVRNPNWRLT